MPLTPTRRDVLIAVLLTGAVLAEVLLSEPVAVSAVAALAVLALAGCRRHPLAAVAILCGAIVADAAAGGVLVAELNLTFGVVIAACFLLGLHATSPERVAIGAGIAVAAMTLANQLAPDLEYPPLDDLVFFALTLGAPAVLGHLLRRRAELIRVLDERGRALREAEEEEAAAAVVEERARLAIGVHDALAHRVGEMSLQAAGAQRVADGEPQRALEALARIEDAGRAALDDIREVIGVLRAGDDLALEPARAPDEAVPQALPAPPGRVEAETPAERARPSRLDVAFAAAVFLALTIEALTSAKREGAAAVNVLACAAIAAPLLARRMHPLASAAAVYAACGAMTLLATPLELLVTPIALLILPTYSVAAYLPRRAALAGLAICVAGSVALGPGVGSGVVALLAFAAGRAVRDRAVRAAELHDVNERLERARGAQAARARGEERLRIARELHDAVAHAMTVVVLQAGAAQRVWGSDPAAARVAVNALTEVARETLAELRETLRGAAPARLDALEELVDRVRPLGLDVTLVREAGSLPPDTGHVVFAVVQEALTNAARHAAPTSVSVSVRRSADDVVVVVADAGRSPGAAPAARPLGTGTGLRGMAERVDAAGGTLRYGGDGPGFRVEARLPVREAVPA